MRPRQSVMSHGPNHDGRGVNNRSRLPQVNSCLKWSNPLRLAIAPMPIEIRQLQPGPPEAYKIYVDEGIPEPEQCPDPQKLQSIRRFLSIIGRVTAGENASVRDCGKRFPRCFRLR
jgi:hypothetical protein